VSSVQRPGRRVFPVMGTMGSIVLSREDQERLGPERVVFACAAAQAELDLVERRFSHYRADSDISRWISGKDVDSQALADIEHVLRECGRLHADSDGAFRAVNPETGALDTAGYVKGYAIGRAVDVLRRLDVANAVIGVGGDAMCIGRASQDRPWRVAVQDPARSHAIVAMVEAPDLAVATSGSAERGEHIWGRRPQPSAIASFTVVGPDICTADAYATIGFAMGVDGMQWVRSHEGYRSLVVRPDGSMLSDAALVSTA
jgi:FAD:protein FMN transferase